MLTYEERKERIEEKIKECNERTAKLEQKRNRLVREQRRLNSEINQLERKRRTHMLIVIGANVVKELGKISESDIPHILNFISEARTSDGQSLREYLDSVGDKKEKGLR